MCAGLGDGLCRSRRHRAELVVAIRKFYYSDVSAILLMIIVAVFVIDIGTGWARGRLFGKDTRA